GRRANRSRAMNRRIVPVAALTLAVTVQAGLRADRPVGPLADPPSAAGADEHRYTISARVRPLLLFWITRNDVGDAVVTRRRAPGEADYSHLIGTDPQRAPLHINRWGYIEEAIRGDEARLVGLMTEAEEESIEQAESNVRTQSAGRHPFKVIHGTADGDEARARVTSINMPEDYTLRQMREVLDLAERSAENSRLRVVRLPPGARPGFLA